MAVEGSIKVIIKRPLEPVGHIARIANRLDNLQTKVDGCIEVVRPYRANFAIICNDMGKLNGMEPNIKIPGDVLYGPIIVVGIDGADITDAPISFDYWRNQLAIWGN
jgi:hypothetical protein